MKKTINFLSRYIKCLYDFNLFKSYFQESTYLAVLFVIPVFLIFATQNYIGAMTPLKDISNSFDDYYDLISSTTYGEIIEFEEDSDEENELNENDMINLIFSGGALNLEQEKVLDRSFEKDNLNYSIIIDTKNILEINYQANNKYSDEDMDAMHFDTSDIGGYITDEYALVYYNGNVMSYDLTTLSGEFTTTEEIYNFLKSNYVNKGVIITFALVAGLFVFVLYYVVVYFTAKSATKRHGYELSRKRTFKIAAYSMPSGAYAYLILNYIMRSSQLALSFLVPIVSMFAMVYTTTKTLDRVKDYVKKEERKIRKEKKRNKGESA